MKGDEQTITVAAAKLYAVVKHLSLDWDKRHVRHPDLTTASMARIDMSELSSAQDELVRSGLLEVMRLGKQTKYIFSREPLKIEVRP